MPPEGSRRIRGGAREAFIKLLLRTDEGAELILCHSQQEGQTIPELESYTKVSKVTAAWPWEGVQEG